LESHTRTKLHPYPSNPLSIIHCQGDDLAIGRQHAEQLGEPVRSGMAFFYADFWRRIITNPPTANWLKPAARYATRAIDPWLVTQLLRRVPQGTLDRIRGLAEVTGQPLKDLSTALVLPDLLPMLQAFLTRVRPYGFIEPPVFPAMACSSFVSRGKHFLHGRNLDFPGVAYWDRYPVLQSTRVSGAIPYLAFTTAGVPFGGITGVNAEQISVSLHQHYSRNVSLSGQLPFLIAEEILQCAKTLQEAKEIIASKRVATAWAFVLTDGKSKSGAIVETDAKIQAVRELGDLALTHSNFFQTGNCRAAEYATSSRMNWDNRYRASRLTELLSNAGWDLEPTSAVTFLSDHWDGFWNEEKVANRIVSQTYNIQSLLLDSEKMTAWIAEGDAPIHLREYTEVDLAAVLDGKDGRKTKRLPGCRYKDPNKHKAKEQFILSFIAAFSGREDESRTELAKTLETDFFPEGGQILALLFWKKGEYAKAKEWLLRGKEWIELRGPKQYPPEYFETCLYLARTHDLLGERDAALAEYRRIEKHRDLEDRNLRRLAKAAGPFRPAQVLRVVMPFSSYIPFE